MTKSPLTPVTGPPSDRITLEDIRRIKPRCCGTCAHAGTLTGGTRHLSAYLPALTCRHALPQGATPAGHLSLLSGTDCPLWRFDPKRAGWSFGGYGPKGEEDLRIYAASVESRQS